MRGPVWFSALALLVGMIVCYYGVISRRYVMTILGGVVVGLALANGFFIPLLVGA